MCSTPRISLVRMKLAVERQHALADVLGEVADPLEIVGHAQRADDLPQIDRHRLAAGDGEDRLLLDLRAAARRCSDRLATTRWAQVGVAARQRLDRVGDLLLGKPAHLRHHAGELLQIDVEGLGGVFGHYHLSRPGCAIRAISRSGR